MDQYIGFMVGVYHSMEKGHVAKKKGWKEKMQTDFLNL
jgi:hypothetical protein